MCPSCRRSGSFCCSAKPNSKHQPARRKTWWNIVMHTRCLHTASERAMSTSLWNFCGAIFHGAVNWRVFLLREWIRKWCHLMWAHKCLANFRAEAFLKKKKCEMDLKVVQNCWSVFHEKIRAAARLQICCSGLNKYSVVIGAKNTWNRWKNTWNWWKCDDLYSKLRHQCLQSETSDDSVKTWAFRITGRAVKFAEVLYFLFKLNPKLWLRALYTSFHPRGTISVHQCSGL